MVTGAVKGTGGLSMSINRLYYSYFPCTLKRCSNERKMLPAQRSSHPEIPTRCHFLGFWKRDAESFRQDRLSQNIQSHVLRFIMKCGTTIQGHRPFTLNLIRWFRFLLVASSWSSLASTRLHLPTNHSFSCITFTIVEFLIVGFLRGIAGWRSLQWGSNVQIWVMWLLYAHANDRIVEMLSFASKTPCLFS
jgi:hypothetical protein